MLILTVTCLCVFFFFFYQGDEGGGSEDEEESEYAPTESEEEEESSQEEYSSETETSEDGSGKNTPSTLAGYIFVTDLHSQLHASSVYFYFPRTDTREYTD